MALVNQKTLALLQQLLMVLRAGALALGIEELWQEVAAVVETDWMIPLLIEVERDRLMAWQLGVSCGIEQ